MDISLALNPVVLPAYTPQGRGATAPDQGVEARSPGAIQSSRQTSSERVPLAGEYGRLRARQDEMNELAQAVRREGMGVEIRKLFPPYPPEQEARMAYLDKISGLCKQIEYLISLSGQMGSSNAAAVAPADELAGDLSRISQRLLANFSPNQAISTNRPLLEGVAQVNSLQ